MIYPFIQGVFVGFLDDFLFHSFIGQFIEFVFYGGGIFAILKVVIWANSWKMFSFYYVFAKQKRFKNHYVFTLIDELVHRRTVAHAVKDPIKKEILLDMFEIEMDKLKLLLRFCLQKIIKDKFRDHLETFPMYKNTKIIDLFYLEYIANRSVVQSIARSRFKRFGTSQEQFNRFWLIYQELSHDYEAMTYSMITTHKNETDIYKLIMDIMNNFNALVELMHMTMGSKFERLNGRLSGIFYKGDNIQ